jgi:hypothetical protein
MRDVKIALVAGLTLLVVGIVVALARSPMSVAHTNGTSEEESRIAAVNHGATYCQAGELLPRGTSAIRLSWFAFTGPRVRLVVYSGAKAITSGESGSGWTSREVTVPVKPLAHTVSNVTVCGSFQMRYEELTVFGKPTPRADAAYDGHQKLPGRMWIEYLRSGTRSWAALVGSILSHMGLGRASSGPGIVVLALAALAAVVALASHLVLRELA